MLSDQYAETIIVWLYIQKPAACAKSKGLGCTSWALMGLGHIGWRSLIYPWHFHKILAHRRYPDLFPRVDASKYHRSGDLIYTSVFLKAGNGKNQGVDGLVPSRDSGRMCFWLSSGFQWQQPPEFLDLQTHHSSLCFIIIQLLLWVFLCFHMAFL